MPAPVDEAQRRARRRDELARRAIAPPRLLGERAGEHGVELLGKVGTRLRRRRRLLVHVRPEERDVGRPRERRLPGQALVEDAAERVDVRALVERVARDLLGGDVLERADDLAGGGDSRERARALGQPEVAEVAVLATAGLRDEDVRGLDVAVDEALLVRGVERLGDLGEELDRALRLERTVLRDELGEVGALDVAHGEEEHAVLLARLVDGDDVRVVERGGDPRLAQEALAEALVLGELGRDHLERDLAPETLLLGAVDRAHAAAADERLDVVARGARSDHQFVLRPPVTRQCVEGQIRDIVCAQHTRYTLGTRAGDSEVANAASRPRSAL